MLDRRVFLLALASCLAPGQPASAERHIDRRRRKADDRDDDDRRRRKADDREDDDRRGRKADDRDDDDRRRRKADDRDDDDRPRRVLQRQRRQD
jgi:hypothetical protein